LMDSGAGHCASQLIAMWCFSRAKLLRFAVSVHTGEKEWKQRGTGDLKLLKHRKMGKIRLLMRQDKTLKICANHVVLPEHEMVS